MNIKRFPLIAALSVGIPLHLLIFALACFQFARIPMGGDEKLVDARENAILISGLIIAIGSSILALAIGALYTAAYSRRFPLTIQSGVLGTVVSNELARLLVIVLFGCSPFALSLQYMYYQTPEQKEMYRLLQVPFFPLLVELGMTLITIPLAALAGAICTTFITRRRASA